MMPCYSALGQRMSVKSLGIHQLFDTTKGMEVNEQNPTLYVDGLEEKRWVYLESLFPFQQQNL